MKKRKRIILLAVAATFLIAAALWYFVFLQLVRVPTGSMSNTILPGDHLVVTRFPGRIARGDIIIFRHPESPEVRYVSRVIGLPGETIEVAGQKVFINAQELSERRVYVEVQDDPADPTPLRVATREEPGQAARWSVYYHKRDDDAAAAGLEYAGGTYAVSQPFRIPLKDDPIPDELLSSAALRSSYDSDGDGRYDSDQYFCMGDNRDNSLDSRYWGTVPKAFIAGRPFRIYWSSEAGKESSGKTRWERILKKLE